VDVQKTTSSWTASQEFAEELNNDYKMCKMALRLSRLDRKVLNDAFDYAHNMWRAINPYLDTDYKVGKLSQKEGLKAVHDKVLNSMTAFRTGGEGYMASN